MEHCDKCGMQMVKRYRNTEYSTSPPQRPYFWWCGCGAKKKGGIERGATEKEKSYEEWMKLNELDKT